MSESDFDEVLELARGGTLLRPSGVRPAGISIVTDLGRAKKMAWEEVHGPDELLWTDLRAREMGEIKKRLYAISEYRARRETIRVAFESLTQSLRRPLGELCDDVLADLSNCAQVRFHLGKSSPFFETLFAIYRSGGWPCGWDGEYPAGTVAAYFPSTT